MQLLFVSLLWIHANFHGHAASTQLKDDGAEPPAELHRTMRARGFDFSVHSAHSTVNQDAAAQAHFEAERDKEEHLGIEGLTVLVGEELTVAHGPRYQKQTHVLGRAAPGNLNHVTLLGMKQFVPSETPLAEACARVHADGGLCLVNHPGPGPMMWEDGLWESPENRRAIDGLEVYNGQALASVGIDFESRYREATAYSGLGLHIAAVTGADTHGPRSVERARAHLAGLGGAAGKLLQLLAPGGSSPRPELEAMTLVDAPTASPEDVIAAVRARRTIAVWNLRGLHAELPGLGEVHPTGEVELDLRLSRPVGEITLYKEGVAVKTWTDAKQARFQEHVDRPAAYVFSVRDGQGRLITSAVWYEPPPAK